MSLIMSSIYPLFQKGSNTLNHENGLPLLPLFSSQNRDLTHESQPLSQTTKHPRQF